MQRNPSSRRPPVQQRPVLQQQQRGKLVRPQPRKAKQLKRATKGR